MIIYINVYAYIYTHIYMQAKVVLLEETHLMAGDPVRTQSRWQFRCSVVAVLQMQEMILTHESIYIQVDQITTDPAGSYIITLTFMVLTMRIRFLQCFISVNL